MPAALPPAFLNHPFGFAAFALTLIAAGVLLLLAFRRLTGTRPHMAEEGKEGHLGIAGSFELGGGRRVLRIRRDGTEHLLLIGGPNDAPLGRVAADNRCSEPGEGGESWRQLNASAATSLPPARSYLEAAKRFTSAAEGLVPLAMLSGAAGACAGVVSGLFRMALEAADRFRSAIPVWWRGEASLGLGLLIIGAAAAAALSAFLVRRCSIHAAGSGIPQVEAALTGGLPPPPFILLPIKFVGGLLAIGAGLALGREGPCVQMSAALANLIGQAARRSANDCRVLLAAGAGAGLAAAFNAPLAGSAFVLEELLRKFDARNAIAALGASGSAIVAAQFITGPEPVFAVAAVLKPAFSDILLCFLLGLAAGLAGAIYNRALFGALAIADRYAAWPVEVRAAAVGAAAGALAWVAPGLAGGGDFLAQRTLDSGLALALLPAVFVLRLILGAASYAAGTPGGLFAPLLALGALMGFLFGGIFYPGESGPLSHAASYALVGMAALFAAVVRAPLTGMILVTEMTANSVLLLPMLAACFSAMMLAALLGEPPVYDALKARAVANWQKLQG